MNNSENVVKVNSSDKNALLVMRDRIASIQESSVSNVRGRNVASFFDNHNEMYDGSPPAFESIKSGLEAVDTGGNTGHEGILLKGS